MQSWVRGMALLSSPAVSCWPADLCPCSLTLGQPWVGGFLMNDEQWARYVKIMELAEGSAYIGSNSGPGTVMRTTDGPPTLLPGRSARKTRCAYCNGWIT